MVEISHLETQTREKNAAAGTSVVAAVFLTAMKLAVGIMTGSLGILAEAAHSGLDLVAALITFFAVRVSDRPADESHTYGHGKVENLSALAETFLLLLTCGWIILEAVHRLFYESKEITVSAWAFLAMAISIVVDFSRSRVLLRAARKYRSQALEADALHFRTDIWSSSVVILGLALVWYGQATGRESAFMRADAVAALIVAIIAIHVSLRLGRRTIDALIDRAPHGAAGAISEAASRVEGVRRVEQVRVRDVGSRRFVDLGISVPRHLSLDESHAVSREVQEAVRRMSPDTDVIVHVTPVADGEGFLERIEAVAAQGRFSVHNVTIHRTTRGLMIDLDLEVDPALPLERAHALATDLEIRLREEFGTGRSELSREVADVNVHVEPRSEEMIRAAEMPPREAAAYIERIEAIRRDLPRAHGIRDVRLQRLDRTIYLSLHLLLDDDIRVSEVHEICEEMENRLRRDYPLLGRVVIHAEPASSAEH